jgi:alanine racemase
VTESSGPPEAEAGGILTIDLSAIVANWRALGARAGNAVCAAVVKADAYGCGIEPVVGALAQAGCRTFFVANLTEARRVRAVAADAAVYVLNGLMPATARYLQGDLRPVIASWAEWDEWCAVRGAGGRAALHLDTGMNRLDFR